MKLKLNQQVAFGSKKELCSVVKISVVGSGRAAQDLYTLKRLSDNGIFTANEITCDQWVTV